ncbi:hypothetical protein ACWFRM_35845, partial [Streptomyces sp. NPDC055144]
MLDGYLVFEDEAGFSMTRSSSTARRCRAAALRFPAAHPAVDSVLVGARSAAEVCDAHAMAAHPVLAAMWQGLRDEKLIPHGGAGPGRGRRVRDRALQ